MAPNISNRIKCEHCPQTFGRRSRYNTHIRKKHNPNPQIELPKCPLCNEFFRYKSNATVHLKRTHKDVLKNIPQERIKDMVVFEVTDNPAPAKPIDSHSVDSHSVDNHSVDSHEQVAKCGEPQICTFFTIVPFFFQNKILLEKFSFVILEWYSYFFLQFVSLH